MKIIAQLTAKMKYLFTEMAEQAAESSSLVQRQRRVTGTNLCQTLILGWWHNPEATLEQLTQMGQAVGLTITPQGLNQRFNATTAEVLGKMLVQAVSMRLEQRGLPLPAMDAFTAVELTDSSVVTFPQEIETVWKGLGGKGPVSSVKLQTRLDLKSGSLDGPHLVHGRTHDNKAAYEHHLPKQAGGLYLQDLGYWKLETWHRAVDASFYLLSYMKTSTHFWQEGHYWTCGMWCAAQQSASFDVPILLGARDKIPARLIGFRADPAIAQERRRKLKRKAKERGDTISKARLALCDWTLIVTNIPCEKMSARDALIWLGVRWQIELLFKLWKSVGHIDKSRSQNPWRILIEFYAKVIAMVLQHWCFMPFLWHSPTRSLTKAAQGLRLHVVRIAVALANPTRLRKTLADVCLSIAHGNRINSSRKHKRTYQKLADLAVFCA